MRDNIDKWLRTEAEKLESQILKADIKMQKLIEKNGMNNFEKLAKLNQEKVILKAQMIKLYEMISRTGEIEG